MRCDKCGTQSVIYKQINSSGAVVVVERCPNCGRNPNPKPFLPKAEYKVDELPLWQNLMVEVANECIVDGCNRIDTQYHHFAPRHLFPGEADSWPGAYLCSYHHMLWHRLVTPDMHKRRKNNVSH